MVYISSIKNVKVMLAGSCLLFSASCVVAEEAPPAPAATTTTTQTVTTTSAASATLNDGQKKAKAEAERMLALAETKLTSIAQLAAKTESETKQINGFKLSAADLGALRDLNELSSLLGEIGDASRLTKLDEAQTELDNSDEALPGVKQQLETAHAQLQREIEQPGVSEAVKSQLTGWQEKLTKKNTAVTTLKSTVEKRQTALSTSLNGLYEKLESLLQGVAASAESLPGKEIDAPALLQRLPKDMLRLEQALRLVVGIRRHWKGKENHKNLEELLDKAASSLAEERRTELKNKIATALDGADTKISGKNEALTGWFQLLKTHCDERKNKLLELYNQLYAKEGITSETRLVVGREAHILVNSGTPLVTRFREVVERWPSLAVQVGETETDIDLRAIHATVEELTATTLRYQAVIVALEEWLAGDMTNFKADQVTLYYFGDVKRLMQSLNRRTQEIRSPGELEERAKEARLKLTKAELAVIAAENQVNTLQGNVLAIREKQRQARAAFRVAEDMLRTAGRQLARLSEKQSTANELWATADKAATDAPNDAVKKLAAEKAKRQLDDLNALLKTETERNEDAEQTYTRDKATYEAVQNEQEKLPTEIADALEALKLAQKEVAHLRALAFLAVQEEMEAFVKARDNAPYLFAPSDGLSTDVARRVQMYAYTDSKTIFLRGTEQDLKEVRNIIAMFDRPAPQARLALWTLELNGNANRKGFGKFNKILQSVENNLSDTRAQLAAAQSILRDVINYKVNEIAQSAKGEDAQLRRYEFYNEEVRSRLGMKKSMDEETTFRVKNFIPDPAGTTTLGEALMVLSLAKPQYQSEILDEFEKRLRSPQIFEKKIGYEGSVKKDTHSQFRQYPYPRNGIWFSSLRIALGIPHEKVIKEDKTIFQSLNSAWQSLTPAQLEIVRALRRLAINELTKNIISNTKHLEGVVEQFDKMRQEEQLQIENIIGHTQREVEKYRIEHEKLEIENKRIKERLQDKKVLADTVKTANLENQQDKVRQRTLANKRALEIAQTQHEQGRVKLEYWKRELFLKEEALKDEIISIKKHIIPVIQYVANELPPSQRSKIQTLVDMSLDQKSSVGVVQSTIKSLRETVNLLEPLHSPITTNARVAAADEMLKRLIIAMEDDLDRHFVQPMLNDLRSDIQDEGVEVGILQRTTVLATNRLVARVDPSATAQLEIGKETDVLEATKQLAQIYLAAQTAGASAVLGTLSSQPEEKQPELYGITTGSTFEVTPIIDPSGQALRFKFDYVQRNDVREPNGTLNPQISRVRRHTVNTEVQLSNLEIRNISQFETNYQLGYPEKTTGGIPILNDLPLLKELPLIGWFRKREGKAAKIQQSIILAQTTIYPTIGDITNLLASPGAN